MELLEKQNNNNTTETNYPEAFALLSSHLSHICKSSHLLCSVKSDGLWNKVHPFCMGFQLPEGMVLA